MSPFPGISLLASQAWKDYELLDSGDGQKLERFGEYIFVRPEVQALWRKSLPAARWEAAHAVFQPTVEESGGHWEFKKRVPEKWEMEYALDLTPGPSPRRRGGLRFYAMNTPGRHLGVFPEGAAHWDWISVLISNTAHHHKKHREHGEELNDLSVNSVYSVVNVLNLFGYTGLATLTAAAAGAKVTHVDASKKAVAWAHENAALSGLQEKPVRWLVDDALKFVQREARRGVKYDGILLDPPKFGRGPKGEVWEVYKSLPLLLQACRSVLSDQPLFVVVTVYAVKASAVHLYYALEEMVKGFGGKLDCGELVIEEKSGGRLLSQAVYARWEAPDPKGL
ncbi:MAG: class I SAM-dependent methyltransferase [Anaerolineales bacterium]|nr:class I SAM-dependent methyltransferase [Anaerolineales bacterium]